MSEKREEQVDEKRTVLVWTVALLCDRLLQARNLASRHILQRTKTTWFMSKEGWQKRARTADRKAQVANKLAEIEDISNYRGSTCLVDLNGVLSFCER